MLCGLFFIIIRHGVSALFNREVMHVIESLVPVSLQTIYLGILLL